MGQYFKQLCQWLDLEAGSELYTVTELQAKMMVFSDGSEVYTVKRLKQKLEEHYGECVFFAEFEGRENVVCFRNMAKYIINDKWYTGKKENIEDEAERKVVTAAKIIKAAIREKEYDVNSYPTNEDIKSMDQGISWVPRYLHTFLKMLGLPELKLISIGQSIIQAARPRSIITPVLFGLGIEMDHVFGSKWLINELARLGFSITYDEVVRYKQSVIQSETPENLLTEYPPNTFTQWVADNVDHNVATLDGRGTFHGMGIIAVSTAKNHTPLKVQSRIISRQQYTKVSMLVEGKGVPILKYTAFPEKGLASVIYKPTVQLQFPYTLPSDLYSDLLWHSGGMFSNEARPRPNWSGFMQHIYSNSHDQCQVSNSEVLFMPIIDLNPSDESCIYSTLSYIESQAIHLNIPTPCITFDQPLWLKAVEIIKAKAMNIVCRLGGFHTLMSFLGSIGSMMKGSGLEEVLEKAYGPNVVNHIISGKAFARALRAHSLVEAALVNKLIGNISTNTNREITCPGREANIDQDLEEAEDKLSTTEIEKIHDFYDGIADKYLSVMNTDKSNELMKLQNCLLKYKESLAKTSRTARLWLQYIEYVETVKLFIRAERIGNWNLHLIAVGKMMNLFAATGHINYAKSSRLYLQLMLELPTDHPWLYNCFVEQGFHSVRRSSRYWAGLCTDLVIEQVMMRSIKSRGGLTRGRGMTETVHLQWIYSMHKCARVHDAMTAITNLKHNTSDQHVELGISRCKRDFKDLCSIQEWFDQHEPFDINEPRLRSLSLGLIAAEGDGINCDKTEQIGVQIQKQLDNISVTEGSNKRSQQVRSLNHLLPGLKVDKKQVYINPTILFSRLIAIIQREEEISPYFDYELTVIPTSLFKDNTMRKTPKSQLAKAVANNVQPCEHNVQATHVIDGGALIHKVKWPKKATYKDIAQQYVSYVRAKYGASSIVFDGYEQGPSIKDHEHQLRVARTCADIQVNEHMEAHDNQQIFLSNKKNKLQFISLLSCYLKANAQTVYNSTGDADTMIVSCALRFATQSNDVIVVADDTDILVLLIHHWDPNMADVYFQSDAQKKMWKIRDLVAKVGGIVKAHLLFVHAWSGCDTTSATFGQGKTTLLKKMKDSSELQQISYLMHSADASPEDIGKAGIQAFIIMYGGKQADTLNHLRYAKYMGMVSTGNIDPQKLPPTERAAHYHSLRVHLQVIMWKKLTSDHDDLDPKQWGWKLDGKLVSPIMTDINAAPENLLKFVRCKCKLSSKNPCGTSMCSCRKHGLKCVTACEDCRGENCNNAEEILDVEEDNFEEGTFDL